MLGSGALGGILGLAAIATIAAPNVGAGARAGLGAAWLVFCGAEFGLMWRRFRRLRRIRLNADLELQLDVRGLGWRSARVLDGSAVLGDSVWLRYRETGGPKGAELLFGKRRACDRWRRFTVILRLAERPVKG